MKILICCAVLTSITLLIAGNARAESMVPKTSSIIGEDVNSLGTIILKTPEVTQCN